MASEPRDRSAPTKRRARERVGEFEGRSPSIETDYRPPGTSAIAFVLKRPVAIDLPGGSVSYSVS
jgi:hypothetical protein